MAKERDHGAVSPRVRRAESIGVFGDFGEAAQQPSPPASRHDQERVAAPAARTRVGVLVQVDSPRAEVWESTRLGRCRDRIPKRAARRPKRGSPRARRDLPAGATRLPSGRDHGLRGRSGTERESASSSPLLTRRKEPDGSSVCHTQSTETSARFLRREGEMLLQFAKSHRAHWPQRATQLEPSP